MGQRTRLAVLVGYGYMFDRLLRVSSLCPNILRACPNEVSLSPKRTVTCTSLDPSSVKNIHDSSAPRENDPHPTCPPPIVSEDDHDNGDSRGVHLDHSMQRDGGGSSIRSCLLCWDESLLALGLSTEGRKVRCFGRHREEHSKEQRAVHTGLSSKGLEETGLEHHKEDQAEERSPASSYYFENDFIPFTIERISVTTRLSPPSILGDVSRISESIETIHSPPISTQFDVENVDQMFWMQLEVPSGDSTRSFRSVQTLVC